MLSYATSMIRRNVEFGRVHFVCYVLEYFFFQAEDGIRDLTVTGVQTCALPICASPPGACGHLPQFARRRARLKRPARSRGPAPICGSGARRTGRPRGTRRAAAADRKSVV